MADSVIRSVRLPGKLDQQIVDLAVKNDRPVNEVIIEGLEKAYSEVRHENSGCHSTSGTGRAKREKG